MHEPLVESLRAHWIAVLGALFIGYQLTTIVYNLYFHPLAKFPGPFLARCTLLWRLWDTMSGKHHRHMQKMHAKYGPAVRVSPNELSFSTVQSYRDIYGFPTPGQKQCTKSELYDIIGSSFSEPCIASERNPQVYSRKKKNLLAAFSAKALVSQEDIVRRCIDDFIAKIGPVSQKSPEGINMVEWFEMSAFDLLGEMAFGESFGCIAEEKHHFWIDMVLQHVADFVLMDNLRRFDILKAFAKWLLPSVVMSVRKKHTQYSRDKVRRRLESEAPRKDFFTNLVSKVKSGEVPLEEMTAHASTLIIAGGETTATTTAAALFYLLKDPRVLSKLNQEIRSRYNSASEIDSTSAQQLPYLQAVINEALRMHPSGAQGFPRISPGTQIDGKWVPKGTEVYTCTWVVSHSPEYWEKPDEFIPERWIDPKYKDVKEASQPFSLGYRACIGRSFAILQMNLTLAKMLYTYDMEMLDKNLDWEAQSKHYIMWWKAPIRIRAYNRLEKSA